MGLFSKHKAIQNLPAHQHALVNLLAICGSRLHVCLTILYLLWFAFYFVLIFTDRHSLWAGSVNLLVVLSFFPFQSVTPKRHLAAVFLKLNIRPSHCGSCEYDLRGTDGDACPECGAQLVPKTETETG